MRWADPATWAGSARWGDFHPAFIWNFLTAKCLLRHCKKIILITWLLSGKFYIFDIDSRGLQQFHFTVCSIMNMITTFSILLQLHRILLILVLLILDFTYLVVLVVAILKSNLERIRKMCMRFKENLSHLAELAHLHMFIWQIFISPKWDPSKIKWDPT